MESCLVSFVESLFAYQRHFVNAPQWLLVWLLYSNFQLSINAFDYNCHVDLIKLLRQEGELPPLRKARQKMSELFPLTEGWCLMVSGDAADFMLGQFYDWADVLYVVD